MTAVAETLLVLLNQFSITGTEAPMQELIAQRVSAQLKGARAKTRIEYHKQSLVVFVEPPNMRCSDLVVVLGHTDTVPGEKIPARIEGDHIIGLGASDMKSGLAVMLELLRAEVVDAMSMPTALVFYAGEEGPSERNELASVFETFPKLRTARLALFAEPTDRTIQLGCLGLLNVRVTFEGKPAHSARPWNGVNAIHRAGSFLTALEQQTPIDVMAGPVTYREVATVTLARGGTATNIVPASFELNLNVRLAPGTDPEQRLAQLKSLAGAGVVFDVYDRAPAGRVPISNEVYERFRAVADVSELPKQAYTDVGLLSEIGVDAVNFGPGLTAQCHVAGEFAKLSDLEWCLSKYRDFLTSNA